MKRILIGISLLIGLVVGLVILDLYNFLKDNSLGDAKGKVSIWWDHRQHEVPQTKDEILKWANQHSYSTRFTDPAQKHLIIYLDRVSARGSILCSGWDVIAEITFDSDNRVSKKYFNTVSDCVYENAINDHLFN